MTRRGGGVAVTGLGVVSAIGTGVGEFTRALAEGRCGITATGLDAPAYAARLTETVHCGPRARGVAGRSSTPVRAAVVATDEAWRQAALDRVPGERVGLVVAGSNLTGWYAYEQTPVYHADPAHFSPRYALRHLDTEHVGVISEIFGVTGEGYTVGGASASGGVAIVHAVRLVEHGYVDACLVVGALTVLSPLEARALLNLGALAAAGESAPGAPFDAAHRGFVPGEASACLVVESRSTAHARGVEVLGEIWGYGIRLDGNSLTDPDERGEAAVMLGALAQAGLDPRDVDYVNTHGTASPRGDATELAALRRVFGTEFPHVWLNATKGLTGHCLSAAGVLEALATVVQLRGGFLHGNPSLRDPVDAGCRFVGDRPVSVVPRVALSNSFGFGGINTSVLLARPDYVRSR